MTDEEAKLILQAYAPNGQSATDPNFQAALNPARCNRELATYMIASTSGILSDLMKLF